MIQDTTFTTPRDAAKYVLFQRTAYLRLPKTLLYRVLNRLSPSSLNTWAVRIEAKFRAEKVGQLYSEDIYGEYLSISEHLPTKCDHLLDIGCGVAGLDVFLSRHYEGEVNIHLLDKTSTETRVFYGFEKRGAFYNSLDIAKRLLTHNGVPEDKVELHIANDKAEIDLKPPADLIISLISWGFHYPVSVYLDRVHEILAPEGRLILDVRMDTDGMGLLEGKFANVQVIGEFDKYHRVMCTKS